MSTKNFIIHQLSGINIIFEFNIDDNLKAFREKIKHKTKYSLLYAGHVIVYDNDVETTSIRKLIEMSPTDFIINDNEIALYLVFNFGYPRKRQGKLLIPHNKLQLIENKDNIPSILLCPITMELIQYPVKINGRFYDLESISEYLANKLNNALITDEYAICCPLRMEISLKFIAKILINHVRNNQGYKELEKITANSVRDYFIYDIFMYGKNSDQLEYNNLLLDYYDKCLANCII